MFILLTMNNLHHMLQDNLWCLGIQSNEGDITYINLKEEENIFYHTENNKRFGNMQKAWERHEFYWQKATDIRGLSWFDLKPCLDPFTYRVDCQSILSEDIKNGKKKTILSVKWGRAQIGKKSESSFEEYCQLKFIISFDVLRLHCGFPVALK